MPAPLEIKVLSIAPAEWTPVVVPFDCSSIAVKNPDEMNAVRMRTAAGDASTEDALGPGREQAFAVPFHRYRFLEGSRPLWLQGAGPVVVKFLAAMAMAAGLAWGQLSQSGGAAAAQTMQCDGSQTISTQDKGTVQILAGQAGKSILVCGFSLTSGGTTTLRLVQGQGSNCAGAQSALTPAFRMNDGVNVVMGGAAGQLLRLEAGRALCIVSTSNRDTGVLVIYTRR